MSGKNLLITGSPGVGKTTLLRKVASALPGASLRGFVTDEIREQGERAGFRIESWDGGQEEILAHVNFDSPYRVGRYRVDRSALDRVVVAALAMQKEAAIYLVDEIGKMECASPKFVEAMSNLLDSPHPLVATVGKKGGGFVAEVKKRDDIELWEASRSNREQMPEQILAWIRRRSPSIRMS